MPKEIKLYPFKGALDCVFGESRNAVREKINLPFEEFKRNQFSVNTLDYYPALGMFAGYDANNVLEALEFTGDVPVLLGDKPVFNFSYNELIKTFHSISKKLDEDISGVTYYDLGFAFYHNDDKLLSCMIFSENYWSA